MTYPPNQPFPGSDPNQLGGSPYGGSPYAPPPPGGGPYGPPPGGAPYGPGGAAGGPPPDNKGWAIAAIFLFWPLCFAAFSASGKVSPLWQQGDFAGAQKASDDAKKWGKTAMWVAVGWYVLWIFCCCIYLVFLSGTLGVTSSSSSY